MGGEWIGFLVVLAVIAALTPFAIKSIRATKRQRGTAQLLWSLFFGFAFLNNRELQRIEDTRAGKWDENPDSGGDPPVPTKDG